MKLRKYWKKVKKFFAAAAVVLCALLLFVVLAGQRHAEPENPMEQSDAKASRMYLTLSTLAIDESLLDGVENANISSGGTDRSGQPEEERKEEEEDRQEEQEQESGEDEQRENTQNESQNSSGDNLSPGQNGIVSDSLLSLIQKNNNSGEPSQNPSGGGGSGSDVTDPDGTEKPVAGGEEMTLNPEETMELFTTSIVDGDRRTEPDYPFTVTLTEKGKARQFVSQTITLNGSDHSYKSFQHENNEKLQSGVNSIKVTLRFADKAKNRIVASTKVYTVYYIPKNSYHLQVFNAKTEEELQKNQVVNVTDQKVWIRVLALHGDKDASVRVRLGNKSQTADQDGIYRMQLAIGANKLSVTTGAGVGGETFTCTVNYRQEEFSLSLECDQFTDVIQGDRFGGTSYQEYRSASESFAFRVKCSEATGREKITSIMVKADSEATEMVYMAGADGYIHCSLAKTKETEIDVVCTDSDGNSRSHTWMIKFIREGETPPDKKPIIEMNLTDGQILETSVHELTIEAKSYNHKKTIYPGQMSVILNGEEIHSSGSSGTVYEYTLNLQEGENILHVTAVDDEQYTATEEIHFFYSAEGKNVSVTIVVDASVVGLGTFIREVRDDILSDQTVAQVVESRLKEYGFTTDYAGSPTGEYYLKAIKKPGLLNNWYISDEKRQECAEKGNDVSDPASLDRLGEFDFTRGSGWMITLNEYFIGKGMGTRPIQDGDVIRLRFTLEMGEDIGGNPESGIDGQ